MLANAAEEACFRRIEGGYDERRHVDGERKRGGGAVEDEESQYSLYPENENLHFSLGEYYSGATSDFRNSVGIIESEKKTYMTELKREGDWLMVLRLVYGDCSINIVSAYAPQIGLLDEVKEREYG